MPDQRLENSQRIVRASAPLGGSSPPREYSPHGDRPLMHALARLVVELQDRVERLERNGGPS